MNTYRYTFIAACPGNGEQIIYALELQHTQKVLIEHIKTACALHQQGYQEDIAADLHTRFGGHLTLRAVHHGVDIETMLAAPAQAQEDAPTLEVLSALPRYQEWLHLREHGAWTAGVPAWARDQPGRMNDFEAARAVIEELASVALAAAPQAPAAPAVDARAERDAAFEAVRNRLCGLQRYSFVLDDDGVVRRAQDRSGNWIEFDEAHELFDPVAVDAAIDAARAAQGGA